MTSTNEQEDQADEGPAPASIEPTGSNRRSGVRKKARTSGAGEHKNLVDDGDVQALARTRRKCLCNHSQEGHIAGKDRCNALGCKCTIYTQPASNKIADEAADVQAVASTSPVRRHKQLCVATKDDDSDPCVFALGHTSEHSWEPIPGHKETCACGHVRNAHAGSGLCTFGVGNKDCGCKRFNPPPVEEVVVCRCLHRWNADQKALEIKEAHPDCPAHADDTFYVAQQGAVEEDNEPDAPMTVSDTNWPDDLSNGVSVQMQRHSDGTLTVVSVDPVPTAAPVVPQGVTVPGAYNVRHQPTFDGGYTTLLEVEDFDKTPLDVIMQADNIVQTRSRDLTPIAALKSVLAEHISNRSAVQLDIKNEQARLRDMKEQLRNTQMKIGTFQTVIEHLTEGPELGDNE